jgi:hypothetical protein
MASETISGRSAKEGAIARAQSKARALGEECLAVAKREAEQVILDLGRQPGLAERRCIEHVAILDVRVRTLRAWNMDREADDATKLLLKSLGELNRMRRKP